MYLQKVISTTTFFFNIFLLASWRLMTKIAGSKSGSISQRHGSAVWIHNKMSWIRNIARKSALIFQLGYHNIIIVQLHTSLFYIERGLYSRMAIWERGMEGKTACIWSAVSHKDTLEDGLHFGDCEYDSWFWTATVIICEFSAQW